MYGQAGNGTSNYGFSEFGGYKFGGQAYESAPHPTGIEQIVLSDASFKSEEAPTVATYVPKTYAGLYLNAKHTDPELFLAGTRTPTPIIGSEAKIMPFIEEAFEKQTGMPFPHETISLVILDDAEFKQEHLKREGSWSEGIQGFSLNRHSHSTSEIFVRKNHLDSMMLTIGHELGHCMSTTLRDARDEEAKAFAFSLAWMQTIKKHNIAGIAGNINPNPAHNGLHDIAYHFVLELMHQGKKALQIFNELAQGIVSITKKLETITMEA